MELNVHPRFFMRLIYDSCKIIGLNPFYDPETNEVAFPDGRGPNRTELKAVMNALRKLKVFSGKLPNDLKKWMEESIRTKKRTNT